MNHKRDTIGTIQHFYFHHDPGDDTRREERDDKNSKDSIDGSNNDIAAPVGQKSQIENSQFWVNFWRAMCVPMNIFTISSDMLMHTSKSQSHPFAILSACIFRSCLFFFFLLGKRVWQQQLQHNNNS